MDFNVLAWICSSIFFSTSLITINKYLTRECGFHWMGLLTSFHFLFTFLLLEIMVRIGKIERAESFPVSRRWLLALWGVGSVVFMNFNLQMNSVGFYQLSKLCTIPSQILFSFMYEGKTTPLNILFSLTILLIGVGLYSVNDVEFNTKGSIIAVLAVAATTGFQWKSAQDQKTYRISGPSCQHASAFPQFVLALICSASTEMVGENSIIKHKFETKEIIIILASAFLAVGVNVSFFGLIGKTSPVTYQVVGHLKTVLILIAGFVLFPPKQEVDKPTLYKTIAGILVSLFGIFLYTYFKLTNPPPQVSEEQQSFLSKSDQDGPKVPLQKIPTA